MSSLEDGSSVCTKLFECFLGEWYASLKIRSPGLNLHEPVSLGDVHAACMDSPCLRLWGKHRSSEVGLFRWDW